MWPIKSSSGSLNQGSLCLEYRGIANSCTGLLIFHPILKAIVTFSSMFHGTSIVFFLVQVDGGSDTENLGLQNIQARVRMVLAFMLSSLMPWVQNKPGFFLVLGSSNVDEGLRGYLTKVKKSKSVSPIYCMSNSANLFPQ